MALSWCVQENYLFSELSDGDLEMMIGAMSRVSKNPGEAVIRQGDKGTEFYILERGTADVMVNDAKVAEYGPACCFGELALIYNAKRAATIIATAPLTLWSLDLRTFRRMLATASSSQTMARIEFLRRVKLLQNLSNEQISKLAGALASQTYADGATILRQGELGETFYLIKEGTVKCTQSKMGREVELLQLNTVRGGRQAGRQAGRVYRPWAD
jgi:CRP-like cAMP-binding protein